MRTHNFITRCTIALVLFSALWAETVYSQDSQVLDISFIQPTVLEDGQPIPAGELAGYRLYYATGGGVSSTSSFQVLSTDQVNNGTKVPFSLQLQPSTDPYVIGFAIVAVREVTDPGTGEITTVIGELSEVTTRTFLVTSVLNPVQIIVGFNVTIECAVPTCVITDIS